MAILLRHLAQWFSRFDWLAVSCDGLPSSILDRKNDLRLRGTTARCRHGAAWIVRLTGLIASQLSAWLSGAVLAALYRCDTNLKAPFATARSR